MYEKRFYEENEGYIISFIVVSIGLILGLWVCHDIFRNEPLYHDTDDTMGRIEERLSDIESRIDTVQTRLDKATETVGGTIVTIREGRENAERIEAGIIGIEEKLDNAIQRSGRIANLIADIEAKNREREKRP